jgi:hypothetical protein
LTVTHETENGLPRIMSMRIDQSQLPPLQA